MNELAKILSHFPKVQFAMAYGSGVFKQRGNHHNLMLDLVFAVSDPYEWHKQNLQLHQHHYSFLSYFGPKAICHIQVFSIYRVFHTLLY